MTDIREIVEADYESIIRLNDSEVQKTSAMDLDKLHLLVSLSSYRRVVEIDGEVAAFLLAMRDGVPYDNGNYRWFSSRFETFLYVDRIVVDAGFAGRKIGSRFYDDLFRYARSLGINTITCEYNIVPPNLISRSFHKKFGFRELGTQWIKNGTRQISYQAAET